MEAQLTEAQLAEAQLMEAQLMEVQLMEAQLMEMAMAALQGEVLILVVVMVVPRMDPRLAEVVVTLLVPARVAAPMEALAPVQVMVPLLVVLIQVRAEATRLLAAGIRVVVVVVVALGPVAVPIPVVAVPILAVETLVLAVETLVLAEAMKGPAEAARLPAAEIRLPAVETLLAGLVRVAVVQAQVVAALVMVGLRLGEDQAVIPHREVDLVAIPRQVGLAVVTVPVVAILQRMVTATVRIMLLREMNPTHLRKPRQDLHCRPAPSLALPSVASLFWQSSSAH